MQRRPLVGVEAGGPGRGAPTAAQEQARVTRDVLDRLLVTCSSDRLADICDRAVLLPQHPATRHRRPCAASPSSVGTQGQCPRRGGEGGFLSRVGQMVGAWGPVLRAIDRRKAVQERALAPQSITLHSQAAVRAGWTGCDEFCRTWPEIGVLNGGCAPEHPVAPDDAIVAAASGAAGAWLQK